MQQRRIVRKLVVFTPLYGVCCGGNEYLVGTLQGNSGGLLMGQEGRNPSSFGLDYLGIQNVGTVHWNLPAPVIYEHAIRRGEGGADGQPRPE